MTDWLVWKVHAIERVACEVARHSKSPIISIYRGINQLAGSKDELAYHVIPQAVCSINRGIVLGELGRVFEKKISVLILDTPTETNWMSTMFYLKKGNHSFAGKTHIVSSIISGPLKLEAWGEHRRSRVVPDVR